MKIKRPVIDGINQDTTHGWAKSLNQTSRLIGGKLIGAR